MSWTGHMLRFRSIRRSIAGSLWRSSHQPKGSRSSTPIATTSQAHQVPRPLSDTNRRPAVTPMSASPRSTKPTQSSVRRPPGADSGTPKRIAKNTRVTAIAGIIIVSTTFPPVQPRIRGARSAPAIAPTWSAMTSVPAARRVVAAPMPVRRPRSKMSAISSGSQTA